MAEHFEPDLLWPLIDEATILLDDGALLAVNKASGIACQGSAHTKRKDAPEKPGALPAADLRARLLAHLRSQREGEPSLSLPADLAPEASGALLFSATPKANGALAQQFEQRRVTKHFLALVSDWQDERRTLQGYYQRRGPEGSDVHFVVKHLRYYEAHVGFFNI